MILDMNVINRVVTGVKELIGSARQWSISAQTPLSLFNFRDISHSDYAFWDRARRGRARGMEISGLLLKPLGSKVAAWVLGIPPLWKVDDAALRDALNQLIQNLHPKILKTFEESLNISDCYIVMNADLSATVIAPHFVKPIVDERDWSKVIGYKITQSVQHPEQTGRTMTVVDEYTATNRVQTVTVDGGVSRQRVFKNVIGMVPVVKVSNILGADEENGRPEGDALVPLLQAYGQVLEAALKGNILQGRPTPVIKKMGTADQVKKFWDRLGRTQTITKADGTTETITTIPFNSDQLLTLGGDAEFSYEAPGSFSSDTETLLGLLFYLLLQHAEIPEFVWGNAISSSKASAESQLEPFLKWIQKKRGATRDWLTQIATIAAAYLCVINPNMKFQVPTIQWQPIADKDGRLTLDAIKFGYLNGLIDARTALVLMPIEINEPDATLFKAQLELEARQEKAAQNQPQKGEASERGDKTPMDQASERSENREFETQEVHAIPRAA